MSSERKPGRTLSADEWASLDSDATRSIERTPDRPTPPRQTNGAMTFLRLAALALLALFTYAMSMIPVDERNAIGSTFAPLFFVVAPTLYFLPTIEAALRKHRSLTSIGLVNLFLGWTLIGWVASIAWACVSSGEAAAERSAPPEQRQESVARPSRAEPTVEASAPAMQRPVSVADELQKLVDLRDQGVLTEDEFAKQKLKLLG